MTDDFLLRLQAATTDKERRWLVTEHLLNSLPLDLAQMAWAATVPHWFDADILAALCPKLQKHATELYAQLCALPFVEPFQKCGHNVHELTRYLMLAQLWQNSHADYVELSQRAATLFSSVTTDWQFQVEYIYHMLIVDPEKGANLLRDQGWAWHDAGLKLYEFASLRALTRVVQERIITGQVSGRGKGWADFFAGLLASYDNQYSVAIGKFQDVIASHYEDEKLTAEAHFRLGDVYNRLSLASVRDDNMARVLVSKKRTDEPIRILHLSDLHFTKETSPKSKLQWLVDDIRKGDCLKFDRLDYLVISGDFTDRGKDEGFEKAYEFVSALTREFDLSAERCIFVPGNHEVQFQHEIYDWRINADDLKPEEWVKQGDVFLVCNAEKYPLRFKRFSEAFFHKVFQRPYPLDYAEQGIAYLFPDTHIQFLTLNSCWRIDQFNRKRSGVHPDAIAHVIKDADQQVQAAMATNRLAKGDPVLRIGVWHHAVTGLELMPNLDFVSHLQNNCVKLCLHGDVHEERCEVISYWDAKRRIHIIGAGSFGSPPEGRPESTPRLYNLLEIQRNLKSVRLHTRCQPRPDGAWRGWNEWPRPDGQDGALPYYDIELK
jgi:predicted phosphodiesterase